jgi:hypothetical protein
MRSRRNSGGGGVGCHIEIPERRSLVSIVI